MTDLSITSTDVAAVQVIEQYTAPAGEALTAGQWARPNPTTGHLELGNGTTAAEALNGGVGLRDAAVGLETTIVIRGIVALGGALS